MAKRVRDLQPGDMVEALTIPDDITRPTPLPGERGVCFAPTDASWDGAGPMVRFMRGGVCNVYSVWVRRIDPVTGEPQ